MEDLKWTLALAGLFFGLILLITWFWQTLFVGLTLFIVWCICLSSGEGDRPWTRR